MLTIGGARAKVKAMKNNINAPDLTKRPPRSPRVRLGGYALVPRMLDKGRAAIGGTNGEYNYACPLDQRFLEFAGIDPEALKQQLATGKGDKEILEWIQSNSKKEPSPPEIEAWSSEQDHRAPHDAETREYFQNLLAKTAPHRKDLATWSELLDVDDFVSFGGKA